FGGRQSLSVRGGRPDEVVTYVDGVPVSPGYRSLGYGNPPRLMRGSEISVGTNAIEEASLTTGAPSAEFGNAMAGVVSIQTRTPTELFTGALAYETDEPFGVNHSLGFNRIQGNLGVPLGSNLGFFLSGVLEGQQSQRTGFDAEKAPIFVPAGVDTTVSVPSEAGNPVSDTTYVPVYRLAASRGNCDAFAGSTNEGIRTNYGRSCQGVRTPMSAVSTYELQGKLHYTYGRGSRVTLSYLGSQNQGRLFDYSTIYNSATQRGYRQWSQVVTLNWTQDLRRTAERALALETYLSYQQDRANEGPLTTESELASRSPFGGLLLRPLGFLFNFDNFPVNDELVDNLREDRPKSRRAPYDVENSGQYNLVEEFSNNAYGLPGWSEFGGPVGNLRLLRESRYIGKVNLDWQVDRYNRVRTGGEFTHHSIDRYETDLQSALLADAYLEKPVRWNLFLEDRLDLGDVVLVGGLRFDAYASRASRDLLLDTVRASATFGEYLAVRKAAQYGADGGTFEGKPLVRTQPDQSHGYLSPHVQVSFPISARTNFRLSYAHQVQAPDFALVLAGVNFGGAGTDLDFGKTILFEFGVRQAFSDDMVLDVAAYNKDHLSVASARTFSLINPLTGSADLYQKFTNADFGNTRGIDIRLDRRIGNLFNGTVSYTFQDSKGTGSDPFTNQDAGVVALEQIGGAIVTSPQVILPTDFSRPHNLAAAVSVTFPDHWGGGSLPGAVLRNLGLFTTFRYASGTPYTSCSAAVGNEAVFSDAPGCAQGAGRTNSARLPAWRQLDLRLTKGFAVGRLGMTAYLDARNLLNFVNTLRVFSETGTIVNSTDRQNRWSTDSSDYAIEAKASEVYGGDGSVDLRFGGIDAAGCAGWRNGAGKPAAPNCVYLIRAEERFGDGDHVFTLSEQLRASDALYAAVGRASSFFARGRHNFTGDPRRLRVGVEVSF
ncbi:MAG: hypothetical protein ACJ8CN_16085, partial [Gemmatimonadales bacterium]